MDKQALFDDAKAYEVELKREYAFLLLKYGDEKTAAAILFPQNNTMYMRAVGLWHRSRDIEALKHELIKKHGANYFVPTKDERILALIAAIPTMEDKDAIAAYRLIAELRGEIVKAVDKRIEQVDKPLPVFQFAKYDDEQRPANTIN